MTRDRGDTGRRGVDGVKDQLAQQALEQALLFPDIYDERSRRARRQSTPEALLATQRQRLDRLLAHAFRQVPAYRRHGDRATDDPFATLRAMPMVDRDDLRRNTVDYCDDDIDPRTCRVAFTSGTSGVPLKIIYDRQFLVHSFASALARSEKIGLRLHRKILVPHQIWLADWFEYTAPALGLARVAEYGADADPEATVERLSFFEPDVVMAHPSNCLGLAELLDRHGRRLSPRVVQTFGERLQPGVRRRLSDSFGCPVLDMYGMRETNTIAAQCLAGSYHIDADRLWVEIVDGSGMPLPSGATGEIVVTVLTNLAWPLLRYRTGDVGSLGVEPCTCGSPAKTMTLVEGRDQGVMQFTNGVSIDVLSVARLIRREPVQRFQIIQRGDRVVELLIAPEAEFSGSVAAALTESVRLMLPPEVRVILRTAATADDFVVNGKRKFTDFVALPV